MPKASPAITSFNSGEWSPLMEGRVDLDRYGSACRTMENFIPLVQGGAQKRPGFRYVRETTAFRLARFSFNSTDSYVVLFSANAISFTRNDNPVYDSVKNITGATAANPVVITSNAHGFTNGQTIIVSGVIGMTELNNRRFIVAGAAANTFQLTGVNGTTYDAYISGGTASRVYIVATPYATEDEIRELQWAGQNDVLYIASPSHPPMKLSRFGNTNWTLTEVVFDYFPFSPENTDDDSFIAASNSAGFITLTASDPIFSASSVGGYIKLREIIESNNAKWAEGINFKDDYVPFATSTGMVNGEHCYNDGKVYYLISKHGGTNTGKQPPVHDEGSGFDGSWEWGFWNYGFGYAKITSYTNPHRVSANVIVPLPLSSAVSPRSILSTSVAIPVVVTTVINHLYETGDRVFISDVITATFLNEKLYTITVLSPTTFSIPVDPSGVAGTDGISTRMFSGPQLLNPSVRPKSMNRWSWGAWDAVRGYPRAVVFHEDRLDWAGTRANPQTAWTSKTSDYEDHRIFDADDSALVFTLSASDPIQWMLEANALVIGTTAEEFGTNRNSAEPLSPKTVTTIRVRSRYGSRQNVHPLAIENVILMVQRAGRKLRQLEWDQTQDALIAPDLTRLAEHISRGILLEQAFQSEPNRINWSVREDGALLGLTYEKDESVFCWHRHPIGGANARVLSVATIPHPDGDSDQLWALIERTIGGVPHRSIEFQDRTWAEGDSIATAHFLDGRFSYSGVPQSVMTGLFVYAGQSLSVLADGVDVGPLTVSAAGTVTLPAPASVVQLGFAYDAVMETLRIEAGAADGTAQGKLQRVTKAVVRVHQAGGALEYGPNASAFRQAHRFAAGTLYDGDTPVLSWPAGNERGSRIALRHRSPLPCTVLAIFPQITTTD